MKKILLVDDDEMLVDALKSALENFGYAVTATTSSIKAKDIFLLDTFDCVISDIRMPKLSGVGFLQIVKAHSSMPFILMTGYAEDTDIGDAMAEGADGFLAKPFRAADLSKLLHEVFSKNYNKHEKEEFLPIPIGEFTKEKGWDCDAYIYALDSRYIKIATGLSPEYIQKKYASQTKYSAYLYVSKEDYLKILVKNLPFTPALTVTAEKKAELNDFSEFFDSELTQIAKDSLDKGEYDFVKNMVQNTAKLIAGDPLVLKDLRERLPRFLAVALFSVLIGRSQGWNTVAVQQRLILAVLLGKSSAVLNAEEVNLLSLAEEFCRLAIVEKTEKKTYAEIFKSFTPGPNMYLPQHWEALKKLVMCEALKQEAIRKSLGVV